MVRLVAAFVLAGVAFTKDVDRCCIFDYTRIESPFLAIQELRHIFSVSQELSHLTSVEVWVGFSKFCHVAFPAGVQILIQAID